MTANASTPSSNLFSRSTVLILFLYFFSGAIGLAYEVLWAKAIANLFGVSIFGVAITVSAFLTGLGAGSLAALGIGKRILNPILFVGCIEIFVALFSFLLPNTLNNANEFLLSNGDSLIIWYLLQGGFSFFLLFVPAFLLGIGFFLVLKHFRINDHAIGWVYGINTLGGVIGVLLPLFLLPFAGWVVSLRIMAVFGLFLGIALIVSSLFLKKGNDEASSLPSNAFLKKNGKTLFAYFLVGLASIILQMVWTRLFGMIFLRTEYVLAIIIATFLLGIALGSLLNHYLPTQLFSKYLSLIVSIFVLVSLYLVPTISHLNIAQNYSSLGEAMFSQGVLIFMVTLPVTFVLGLWYPFLAKTLSLSTEQSVILYGINSIGAGIGALLAIFVFLPLLGAANLIGLVAVLILFSGLLWSSSIKLRYANMAFAFIIIVLVFRPTAEDLLPDRYSDTTEIFFHEDALAATHVIEKKSGERLLLNDLQRMDASSDYAAVHAQRNQARLPLLLNPNASDILFLGLGTGITISPTTVSKSGKVDVVEISQGAINAAKLHFAKSNLHVLDKVNVIKDDARRFLKSQSQTYDLIVGDLFHPDLVGRGNLLAIQQFERSKARLSSDGIFVQWIAMNQFDLESVRLVLNTFAKSYSNNVMFIDGFRLALVGFKNENLDVYELIENLLIKGGQEATALNGESSITWLSRFMGSITYIEGDIQDDWSPILDYSLPKLRFQNKLSLTEILPQLFSFRPELSDINSAFNADNSAINSFVNAYTATELFYQSVMAEFAGHSDQAFKFLKMAFELNPDDYWISFKVADQLFANPAQDRAFEETLQKVISIRPDHIDALSAQVKLAKDKSEVEKVKQFQAEIKRLEPYHIF